MEHILDYIALKASQDEILNEILNCGKVFSWKIHTYGDKTCAIRLRHLASCSCRLTFGTIIGFGYAFKAKKKKYQ